MIGVRRFALFGALLAISSPATPAFSADEDGVALAIVCDTSGSMRETVRGVDGRLSPKYVVAGHALESIAIRVQAFATNATSGVRRRIDAGLFVFSGRGVKEVVKFGRFDAAAIQTWARKFSAPDGGTPLGTALVEASEAVLNSNLTRKHVLVITDGVNTVGPDPASVMPRLKRRAGEKGASLSVHFVAFDVDAAVFAGVKKLGASVMSASDEKQLKAQLESILAKQILLEEEELPAKK